MAKNNTEKTNKINKTNKVDKSKIFVRIMAVILAALMVLGMAASLIYALI